MTSRWRQIAVILLFVVFGWSSWIDVNGLWVELPLIVYRLPEGWSLPAYFTVIIQFANLGPLCYGLLRWVIRRYRLSTDSSSEDKLEMVAIYLIIIIGALATFLLSFYWDVTSIVGGVEHSTVLLVLVFFLSLVDCTSSVTFLPFLASFKPTYMAAFYVGEGMSGLLPTAIAFIQGSGEYTCVNSTTNSSSTNWTEEYSLQPKYEELLFPVRDFFLALFVMLVMSIVAFSLLKFSKFAGEERLMDTDSAQYEPTSTVSPDEGSSIFSSEGSTSPIVKGVNSAKSPPTTHGTMSNAQYYVLLCIMALICGLSNGVLPSIQIYSILPYGQIYYSLGVKLSTIANPLACFLGFFLMVRNMISIAVMTVVAVASAIYIMIIASYSPVPPVDSQTAAVFMVVIWIIFKAVVSYMKVSISKLMMERGHSALFWTGVATQIGSFVGAIITFICVTVLQLLQSAPSC